ncbi:hypothetical protein A2U01_0076770, partial [Trifolium medium]|nr:hypothetical protein [Trifolium medium]
SEAEADSEPESDSEDTSEVISHNSKSKEEPLEMLEELF